jgi:TRAP transporter TAXI family solute receptor
MATGAGLWRRVASSLLVAFVIAVLVLGVLVFVVARPPRQLTIASGPDGGMYHDFAARLSAQLARRGFRLRVLTTDGSVDNVALLAGRQADIAVVQSGTDTFADMSGVSAIAELFYEPVWLFHRQEVPIGSIEDLAGRRVSIGPDGSGTNALARRLLELEDVDPASMTLVLDDNDEAVADLRSGGIDAAFFVVSPAAQVIADLVADPTLDILAQPEADAYSRHLPFLAPVVLGHGVLDLVRDVPAGDLDMVAVTATLVARDGLNPDLARLLVESVPAALTYPLVGPPGRFPTLDDTTLPVNDDARRYLAEGPTPLERVLPFDIASPLSRLYLVLLPLVVLIFPLWHILKSAYAWWMFGRIGNYYPRIHAIERGLARATLPQLDEQLTYLRDLDAQLPDRTRVTTGYLPRYFDLRAHIAFVERQVSARRAALLAQEDEGPTDQAGEDTVVPVDPGATSGSPAAQAGQVAGPGS